MDVPRWIRSRLASPNPFGRDALLAAGLLLLTAVEIVPLGSLGGWEPRPPAFWPLLAAATVAPLAWRRRRPVAAAAAQAAAATATVPLSGHLEFSAVLVVCLLIGPYSAGTYSSRRTWSLAVVLAGGVMPELMHGLSWWLRSGVPGVSTVVPLTAWLVGHSVRVYREQLADLRERALRLERERDATARAAVAEERARIARELHDVVAHGVSVMVVQSEAARRLLRRRPDEAEAALRTVSATGTEALAELRHVLGVLAGDGPDPELEPAPRLGDLGALVDRIRSAGLIVELHLDGEVRTLPRGLDLTAYRIVQEALTNVLKHARTSRAEVRLRYADDSLDIDVTDAGRPAGAPGTDGAGRGLVGMRERVAAYGGELEVGPRSEGGYAVRARLPLELAG